MIAKIKNGSGAYGCSNYILNHDKVTILSVSGLDIGRTEAEKMLFLSQTPSKISEQKQYAKILAYKINRDFSLQASLNPRTKKNVVHISINFKEEDNERLTDDFLAKIAKDYLYHMGFLSQIYFDKYGHPSTQYLIAKHTKKDGTRHIHIILNRIDNLGHRICNSYEHVRNINVVKQLKKKYGLTFAKSKELTRVPQLHGPERTRYEIFHSIKNALEGSHDLQKFEDILLSHGIKCKYAVGKNGQPFGISYEKWSDEDNRYYEFKGSKIDRQQNNHQCKRTTPIHQESKMSTWTPTFIRTSASHYNIISTWPKKSIPLSLVPSK